MKYILFLYCNLIWFNIVAQDKQYVQRFYMLDSIINASQEGTADRIMPFATEQLAIATILQNDSLIILANTHVAATYASLGVFDKSLQICYNNSVIAEKKGFKTMLGELYFAIGGIYFTMQDFPRYLSFNEKAKQAMIDVHQYNDTAKVNAEIGLALVGLGKATEGITLLKSNIATLQKANDEEKLAGAIDNLSNCYTELNDYESALQYQLQLLQFQVVNNNLAYKTGVHQHLAEIYINLKNYTKAQQYLSKAIQFATELKSNDWLFDCYKNQSAIYEATGNTKLALLYHQKYVATKDSVYQKDYDSKMSTMANMYELNSKQNAIKKLEIDKLLSNAKIQRLYLIIASLLLLLIIVALLINHKKNKNEKILRLQFSEQLLQTQESERQKISRDLHDSVGQNLLFIKNQIQKLNNTNAILNQSIDNALEEVRNISKDLYPNQLEKYGLQSAIDGLCQKIKESTTIFITSDFQFENENLSKEKKINCFRIVQECINNIIKHAAASAIRITGHLVNNQLQLTIQDNGKGFEKNTLQASANHSFGMLNMQERVRILNATFVLETAIGKGTKSIFTIPIY